MCKTRYKIKKMYTVVVLLYGMLNYVPSGMKPWDVLRCDAINGNRPQDAHKNVGPLQHGSAA